VKADGLVAVERSPAPRPISIAESSSGEAPEILAALEEDDPERALELLLEETVGGDSERRERMRELAVALFAELGHEHALSQRYRRRLARAL